MNAFSCSTRWSECIRDRIYMPCYLDLKSLTIKENINWRNYSSMVNGLKSNCYAIQQIDQTLR